ncbi:MAG TPA: hypothetical protein PLP19_22305 [bacterium]|nr:hypothetical protein [bacterium]HPN46234.1 hypothetical protein [bacterium]
MNEREKIQVWIATWQMADAALDKLKKQELQDKDYYLKNRDLLNSMLQYAYDHRTVRNDSGLVIMQKYFKQYYLQQLKKTNE